MFFMDDALLYFAASLWSASSKVATNHTRLLRGERLLTELHFKGENLKQCFCFCRSSSPAINPWLPCLTLQELYEHMNGSLRGSTLEGSQVYLGA